MGNSVGLGVGLEEGLLTSKGERKGNSKIGR